MAAFPQRTPEGGPKGEPPYYTPLWGGVKRSSTIKNLCGIFDSSSNVRPCDLVEGISSGEWIYYVHSYAPSPEEPDVVSAVSEYGGLEFPSVVFRRNIYGTQFHPEKSGETGRKILRNFVGWCVRK
jgi:hypothetical protein